MELLIHSYRFVYTDEVQLNADNVLQVMYAAKKYIITNLSKKCTEFLLENLSAETAPQLLEQSIFFDEQDLKAKVLAKIVAEAPAILSTDEFTTLSKEALHEVLQLNLQINNEMEVFNASVKWAERRCQQLNMMMDGANFREVLGDNLFLIRFPIMTFDEVNDAIIPQDILTDREGLQLLHFLTAKSKPANLPFPTEPRFDPTPRALLIPAPYDEQSEYIDGLWTVHTNLNCTLSRPVKIKKIFIHSEDNNAYIKHNLVITLTQNGKTLLNYAGEHAIIPGSEGIPRHFAVEANNACVEAGALQVDIQLKLTIMEEWYVCYSINSSPKTMTKLSDNFVSLAFTPVDENLFLGFEYSLN